MAEGCERAASADLADRLGHRFADPHLLDLARRHRSWCAEHGALPSNERLEFLGDSVLGLVVTEHLFRTEPDLPEGTLAQRRAELVNSRTLADVARRIELGRHVLLGRGEASTGGAEKESILADAFEAVLGAVYLDAGLDATAAVILRLLGSHLSDVSAGRGGDYKSRLQEVAARELDAVPVYVVEAEGPDHARSFTAEVRFIGADPLPRHAVGRGAGRSKKAAEQAAARAALGVLVEELADRIGGGDG